jgi:hypothetical protein
MEYGSNYLWLGGLCPATVSTQVIKSLRFGGQEMRWVGLLVLLLFCRLSLCQTPDDQPSLEVTMNWLIKNLHAAKSEVTTETVALDKNGKPKGKIREDHIRGYVLATNAHGCDLTITSQMVWNLDLAKISVDTIPMGRVAVTMETVPREAPDASKHVTFIPASSIHIYLTAQSALIRDAITTHLIDNSVQDTTTVNPTKRATIELDDAELAPRLVKALQHAAQICSKIPAPSEPF